MLAIRLSDEIESRLDSLAKANRQNKDVLCAGSNTGASGRPGGLLSFSRNCCTRSPW